MTGSNKAISNGNDYNHICGVWIGYGCLCCIYHQRNNNKTSKNRSCLKNCTFLWVISGNHASDWVVGGAEPEGFYFGYRPLDRLWASELYWLQNDL